MTNRVKIIEHDKNVIEKISRILNCSKIVATLIVTRGFNSPETAFKFINPSFDFIRHPFSLKDMDKAVKRIYKAVKNNEKILIYGDYDVDGVTSSALLYDFFKIIGADVSYYIPHRTKEGYGLKIQTIKNIKDSENIKLIITVDCGSSDNEAVEFAINSDIDVIITDHHKISDNLPKACAIINPNRYDCTSGLEHLAGVGVVFYLIISLRIYLREKKFWSVIEEPKLKDYCELVALGTIADIVPLIEENRIFSKIGLEILVKSKRPGINSLIELCNINKNFINSEDISYKLAPRINAAGRMDSAIKSVELLSSKNYKNARNLSKQLDHYNDLRKEVEKKIENEILLILENNTTILNKSAIVLSSQEWEIGVLGIVASKISKMFNRPTILIESKNDICKGSCRSIARFNIYNVLKECKDDLVSFGGHSMAAGISIINHNIKKFENNFEHHSSQIFKKIDLNRNIMVDYEIEFNEITDELADELEILQPYGRKNSEPLFITYNITVVNSSIVGTNHRKILLMQKKTSDRKLNAIQFNIDLNKEMPMFFETLLFRIRKNNWNEKNSLQLIIENISYA